VNIEPTFEIAVLVLTCIGLFFVVSAFGLRVSCDLANRLGRWSGRVAPLGPVPYRHALGVVFLAVVVLSLGSGIEQSAAAWAGGYFGETVVRTAATVCEWLLFGVLVAAGLASLQPQRNRLVFVAAAIHVALVIGGGYALAAIIAAVR
jgi:hypothetical protein